VGAIAALILFAAADGRAPTRLYQPLIHGHSANQSFVITEPNEGSQYSIITKSMQSQMEISARESMPPLSCHINHTVHAAWTSSDSGQGVGVNKGDATATHYRRR
jgi:hypothetical protein